MFSKVIGFGEYCHPINNEFEIKSRMRYDRYGQCRLQPNLVHRLALCLGLHLIKLFSPSSLALLKNKLGCFVPDKPLLLSLTFDGKANSLS